MTRAKAGSGTLHEWTENRWRIWIWGMGYGQSSQSLTLTIDKLMIRYKESLEGLSGGDTVGNLLYFSLSLPSSNLWSHLLSTERSR